MKCFGLALRILLEMLAVIAVGVHASVSPDGTYRRPVGPPLHVGASDPVAELVTVSLRPRRPWRHH